MLSKAALFQSQIWNPPCLGSRRYATRANAATKANLSTSSIGPACRSLQSFPCTPAYYLFHTFVLLFVSITMIPG